MDKRIIPLLMSVVCMLCVGCTSLLERSYSSVVPYTDRYWDSGAEDTLKAESYQDLVNSLLMLIEQRSEEGVIRYYAPEDVDSYAQAVQAKREVQNDTVLGSYLLSGMSVMYASNDGYCTLTYFMSYRSGTQDLSTLMSLTDSQSLTDLLRLAVREEHDSITAQFISKTSRDEVLNVVESLWREMYRAELEKSGALPTTPQTESGEDTSSPDAPPADGDSSGSETSSGDANGSEPEPTPDDAPPSSEESPPADPPSTEIDPPADDNSGEDIPPSLSATPQEPQIQYPPCPWVILFYPDADYPEIVEIRLK